MTRAAQGSGSKVDEAIAVFDHPSLDRAERDRLLQVLGELSADLSPGSDVEALAAGATRVGMPTDGDEQLVVELKAGLARLVGRWADVSIESAAAVQAALDGVEFAARIEILAGKSWRLPRLLPGFVFLTLLPLSGAAEAIRTAELTGRLLER